MKMTRSLKFGLIHGTEKGLLFFAVSEFIMSTYFRPTYSNYVIIALASFVLTLFVGVVLFLISGAPFSKFYWSSQAAFLISSVLQIINQMTFHLHIFQPRELNNADGLILLGFQISFLLYTELIQFILLGALALFKQSSKTD